MILQVTIIYKSIRTRKKKKKKQEKKKKKCQFFIMSDLMDNKRPK